MSALERGIYYLLWYDPTHKEFEIVHEGDASIDDLGKDDVR